MPAIELMAGDNPPLTVTSRTHVRGHPAGSRIVGEGRLHGVNVAAGSHDVLLEGFTVTGSPVEGTHGIRAVGATRLTIRDVTVRDCASYGIGLQGRAPFRAVTLERVEVYRTGRDGIDIKNDSGMNRHCVMREVLVRDHGLAEDQCAALDIRGRWTLTGIRVETVGQPGRPDLVGIRFRRDGISPDGTRNGSANWSILCGYIVRCTGAAAKRAVVVEPSVAGFPAPKVAVSGGKVFG